MQRRKGHETKGLSSLLVGTLDTIFDSRPPPFRILHQTPQSEISYTIACSLTRDGILRDWLWIEDSLMPTLASFETNPLTQETEKEITDFVKCKIESVLAQESLPVSKQAESVETSNFKAAVHKFRRMFAMPEAEKLVNCKYFPDVRDNRCIDKLRPMLDYSCSFWKNHVPRQGWLYLSVNHMCFYSFLFGKETKIVIKWADVQVIRV